ncbi:MAG TPA: sugar transferase [Roseiflexaceae bacterium]|nr:sugar transferase [Roseiflexaceae bacterium]
MSVFELSLSRPRSRTTLRKQEQWLLVGVLLLTDACVVALSFTLSYAIRFWVDLPIFDLGTIKPDFYAAVVAVLIPCFLLLFNVYGLYNRANLLGGTTEYARFFNAVTAGMLAIIFLNFLWPDFVVARAWLLLSWALMISLGFINRGVMRQTVYALRRSGRFLDRTLIVGANPEGLAVTEQLLHARSSGAQIVGFIDDYLPVGSEPLPGVPVLGGSAAFASIVTLQSIDTAVIANTAITRERLLGIYSAMDALQNVEVRLASGLFELLTTGVRVHEEGFVPLVVLNKTRITGIHLFCKTLLDYLLAGGALLVFSPLFLLLYVLVWRDSPGPVIYRRRVVGQGKHEFDAFKFRTMRIEGDALLTPEQKRELEEYGKLKEDPRITRAGALLRKYSLDELPQLLNVLRGEMSLIGPRMITLKELEKFGKWQHNLTTVKPGLTGLWQISGRSDLSYDDRVRLDMHYIRNHSIWLDLQILFKTIPALISGRGAY